MKIAIGILTNNRPHQLCSLVEKLQKMLSSTDEIVIVNNGNIPLPLSLRKFSNVTLLPKSRKMNIPTSRNTIIQYVLRSFEVLAFIDDDCDPSPKWVAEIKKTFILNPSSHVVEGAVESVPKHNIFAQTTELLSSLWFHLNSLPGGHTKILDTKNCALRLSYFRTSHLLFDEHIAYGSDIDLGFRLNMVGCAIDDVPSAMVFHTERSSTLTFIAHRFRISKAYRRINARYGGYFTSASVSQKYTYLWEHLSFGMIHKFFLLICLTVSYSASMISSSMENIFDDRVEF